MRRSHHSAQTCGSGLARDGINAVWLAERSVCIAGKPAPTGYAALAPFGPLLWERACPRWNQRGLAGSPQCLHRRQARDGINAVWLKDRSVSIAGKPAPTGHAALAPFGTYRWERACPRWHQRGLAGRPQRLQANQWLCGKCSNRVLHTPAICSSSNLTASSTSPARQASRISRCSWSARCLPADKLICMRR